MICGKCDLAIQVDEGYDRHDKVSSSAGGITIYLHKQCPRKGPRNGGRRIAGVSPRRAGRQAFA